ncbi:MAG: hypothetical protein HGB26_09225, partial [Desulfobulbaceae bacterium]|nr:hypothetical protein [Desulfobulbaceae bacterium]
MIDAQSIAVGLGGIKSGRGFVAPCPAHDDREPSLSINDGDNGPLVCCQAGCSQDDVISELTERGLWSRKNLSGNFTEKGKTKSKAERESDEVAKQEEAARKALIILAKANGNPASHQYAIKKGVPLAKLVKRGEWPQRGWLDALLIPLYDNGGKISSISAINFDGKKDLLKNGKSGGCFHPLGKFK